jgi:hypothetical protein
MRLFTLALLATAVLAQDDLTHDLLDAAATGDTARVRANLEAGVKVDAAGKNGRTALMVAAQHGRVDTVKALLAAGANTDLRDESGLTAYGLALFESAGRGSRDPVLKLLPQPARLRLSAITGWSAQGLVSSCFQQRAQIVQQMGLMKPDEMMLRELQAYIRAQGKGLGQLVAVDARGVDPLKAEPGEGADGIIVLEIEPGSACAGGTGDNLTFQVEMKILRGRDGAPLLEKRIGGGLKGLRTLKVENAAQYRPVYETWLKEQPQAIYWDAVEILMKSAR